MIHNFKGHNRYHLIENFNHCGEVSEPPYFKEDVEIDEYRFLDFLNNYCNERFTEDELYNTFGCVYVSSGGFALLTLDTNEYVFIDDEYYMSYLAEDINDVLYVVCVSHEDERERYFRIC